MCVNCGYVSILRAVYNFHSFNEPCKTGCMSILVECAQFFSFKIIIKWNEWMNFMCGAGKKAIAMSWGQYYLLIYHVQMGNICCKLYWTKMTRTISMCRFDRISLSIASTLIESMAFFLSAIFIFLQLMCRVHSSFFLSQSMVTIIVLHQYMSMSIQSKWAVCARTNVCKAHC